MDDLITSYNFVFYTIYSVVLKMIQDLSNFQTELVRGGVYEMLNIIHKGNLPLLLKRKLVDMCTNDLLA